MGTEQIRSAFREDFDNPGSLKSGEYLSTRVLETARRFVQDERSDLVQVLREWLLQRQDPQTMLSVTVVAELRLTELKPDLLELKREIDSGHVFMKFYARRVNLALDRIDSSGNPGVVPPEEPIRR